MITPEMIREAEARAAAAEAALDTAETADGLLLSRGAADALIEQRGQTHAARDDLRRLRTGYARQEEQRRARERAEAGFAPEVDATAARLAECRERAAEAVAACRVALARMLEACAAYDGMVKAEAGSLRDRGLVGGEGESWGGTRGGVVILPSGERHVPLIDGGCSLAGLLATEAVALADSRHPLGRQRLDAYGGPGAVAGRRALLARSGVSA